MDNLRIPPTDLGVFLAERTARIERTRSDRDHRPPAEPKPQRRGPDSGDSSDAHGEETPHRVLVDA